MAEINIGNLYDINRKLMAEEKPMTLNQLREELLPIAKDLSEKNTYFLLINRDIYYYTIFNCKMSSYAGVRKALLDILTSLGEVLSIEKQENGTYEIWIHPIMEKLPIVYYLADWTQGVIECE